MTGISGKRVAPFVIAGLAAGLALALSAPGAQAERNSSRGDVAPDQCVYQPIDTTRIVDSRTLYVDDRRGHAVLLHMTSPCLNSMGDAVGLKFQGSGSICGPLDVDVTDSIFTTRGACLIDRVEALDPDRAKGYRNGR